MSERIETSTEPREAASEARVRALVRADLTRGARVGHVLLLVVTVLVAAAVGSLWATEPSLPTRTSVMFLIIIAGAVSWAGYAAWTLTHRRPRLAGHEVVATRVAMMTTAVVTVAMVVATANAPSAAMLLGIIGTIQFLVAAVAFRRARRRFAWLLERRATLDEMRRLGA